MQSEMVMLFPMKRVSGILQALYLCNLRSNQKSDEALVDKTGVITWDFLKSLNEISMKLLLNGFWKE